MPDQTAEPSYMIPRHLYDEIVSRLRSHDFFMSCRLADRLERLAVLAEHSQKIHHADQLPKGLPRGSKCR